MNTRHFEYLKTKLERNTTALTTDISSLERAVEDQIRKLRRKIDLVQRTGDEVIQAAEEFKDSEERRVNRELRELRQEVAKWKSRAEELELQVNGPVAVKTSSSAKAATIAIYDSILFAIENWSIQGDTAPDITLASQSILFPVVYRRVMEGDEDYFIPTASATFLEVVKRGREFVSHIRRECEKSLVDEEAWEEYAWLIQAWWINDALPLLYGARSDDWDNDKPMTLEMMKKWRDEPASRALEFPLIFDGMELIKKHGDEIRETTGLPEFNKNTLTIRINNE